MIAMCRNMFNKEMLGKMKKGAFLVNTARGGICERDAIVEALESGQLGGRLSGLFPTLIAVTHCLAHETRPGMRDCNSRAYIWIYT